MHPEEGRARRGGAQLLVGDGVLDRDTIRTCITRPRPEPKTTM